MKEHIVGFDISFHPVDTALIHSVVTPYLVHGAPIPDSTVSDGVRIALNRFRANAWGLGVMHLDHERRAAERARGNADSVGVTPEKTCPDPPRFEFDTDLYVWGRPFFITDEDPAAVSARVDAYLACANQAAVDHLAREMIAGLSPALIDLVAPSEDDGTPTPEAARHAVFWKLDLLREAVAALPTGRLIVSPRRNAS